MPRLSIILSTYEKPSELRLALESLRYAEDPHSKWIELIVADDGSGSETAGIIESFGATVPFDVIHVHHEDRGFRLAKIRNAAIRKAKGDILFFVDGDSLVHPTALQAHAKWCIPGTACAGTRFFLDDLRTRAVADDPRKIHDMLRIAEREGAWSRRKLFVMNAFYRHTRLKRRPKLIGGNCAVHHEDLERVNGFDERFVGWGLEDDDLARRLRRSGVRVRDVSLGCFVVHLHHPPHPSHQPSVHHTANYAYYHRRTGYLTRCRHGLETRTLRDVTFELARELPEALTALREELGRPPSGEWAEVFVLPPGPDMLPGVDGGFEVAVQLAERVLDGHEDPIAASQKFLLDEL